MPSAENTPTIINHSVRPMPNPKKDYYQLPMKPVAKYNKR